MKFFEKVKINNGKSKEREIRILGFPICKYGKVYNNNTKEKYCEIFPKKYIYNVLDQIINQIGTQYDYVWICRVNAIGENYLLNFLYDEVVANNNIKKYCFVFHQNNKHVAEIFKLFSPVETYITSVPLAILNSVLEEKEYFYKNIKFHVHHCPLKETSSFLSGDKHYTQVIKELVGATKYYNKNIKIPSHDFKLSLSNLNIDNFVFINPEVKSLKPLSCEFWSNLCTELKNKGYDIYVNSKKGVSSLGHAAQLSIIEALYLASKAKYIITMRTGFSELLSCLNIPMHTIYTDSIFEDNSVAKVRTLFSLQSYPLVNTKTLYEYQEINETLLLQCILKRIQNVYI